MRLRSSFFVPLLLSIALTSCTTLFGPAAPPPLTLTRVPFASLDGWAANDPRPALAALARSCAVLAKKPDGASLGGAGYAGTAGDWRDVCSANPPADTPDAARDFVSANFAAYRVMQGAGDGLFTGYYEPELKGSRTKHDAYQTPLYGVPNDLVTVDLGLFRDTLKGQRLTGRVTGGKLIPYPPRAEIVKNGAPAPVLVYVDNPVDAFFLQIQGSGRIVLDDGSVVRAVYAGQNGQPYTAIGVKLIEMGELTREQVSLQTIRAWLVGHPGEAEGLMDANASYVFFAEQPIGDSKLGANGSLGAALTPEASLAVDAGIHALGAPVYLETSAPDADPAKPDDPFDRLLVMQDTGGAIRGSVRGDVYWGVGGVAGEIAGRMKSAGRMSVLLPKSIADRLGASATFTPK